MNTKGRQRIFGITALTVGLLLSGAASAWYGGPWYRPYGSGAMTYERQNLMRDHGYAMEELTSMFNGRRVFNREEAIRLTQELEDGLGEQMLKNFAPGTWVAGSRTTPWTWRNPGAFSGYAEAAKQSAGRLAEALEEEPTKQEIQEQGAWVTPQGMRPRAWGRHLDGLVSMDAIREYGRLDATCYSCHRVFRSRRW